MPDTSTAPQTSQNSPSASTVAHAAVVTGASSGIGRATALRLAQDGWTVYAVARRAERLHALADQVAGDGAVVGKIIPLPADVTDPAQVARVQEQVQASGGADTVLTIAGGALGTDIVGEGSAEQWETMFRSNVLGTLHVIKAFLPMLRASGSGTILVLTSTAGLISYEGGGGYNAAKMGQHGLVGALRLEEAEHNVRVVEVLPGLVQTEEFSLNRLGGDRDRAAAVYEGVEHPLTAEDIADICSYAVNAPHHVNLDQIVVRPVAQAAAHKLIRKRN